MNLHKNWLLIAVAAIVLPINGAFAQKVQVGYDKSVDFSRYKTYTVADPAIQPTRPLLYASIVGSIDQELTSKGLARTQNNGDLILIPEGGTEVGFSHAAGTPILPTYGGPPPDLNSTMWTGAAAYTPSAGIYVPEGALRLEFIDRTANKVVWSGTVKVKLDVENKTKSLELIDKAVIKLLKEFPPEKK